MIAIHQLLLVVLRPVMLAPVDVKASLMEIIRVTKEDTAIMAIHEGRLVGTLGLIRVNWWYAPEHFYLADRWQAVLPQYHHGEPEKLLEAEARQIADMSGLKFVNYGKIRPQKHGNFILFPRVYDPNQLACSLEGS